MIGNSRPVDVGNPQHFGALVNKLKRRFAPVSIFQPPLTTTQSTGNRRVALSNQKGQVPPPLDSKVLALNGGRLTWYFSTKFPVPPVVTALPAQGAVSTGRLTVEVIGRNAVIVVSSDTADNRLVHLIAQQDPNQ